jgi:hypothetical protein
VTVRHVHIHVHDAGYVSKGLYSAVQGASASRNVRSAHERGDVYSVVYLTKAGAERPISQSSYNNLSESQAERMREYYESLNPGSKAKVIKVA